MKAKKLKITAPSMKLRNGLMSARTELHVFYFEHRVGVPWAELRPLIASAFRHVQKEAFRDHGSEFVRRSRIWTTELYLHKSKRGWWGRNVGARSRVFIGKLHEDPQETRYPKFKDMPVFWHMDWREHLVGLVAHELWHRWQPGHGKPAEMMCETVEQDAIDTYRREQGYVFKPFTVHLEPDEFKKDEAEQCVDCRQPSRYWMTDQHTPLCPECCLKRNIELAKAARNGGSHE
jgi:hypothetical protein